MIILAKDLQVGDVIIRFKRKGWTTWSTSGHPSPVEKIGPVASQYKGGCTLMYAYVNGSLWLELSCDKDAAHDVVELEIEDRPGASTTYKTSAKKADNRFPHKCTACGRAAYVGFSSVDHEVDAGCKAR